MSLTSALGTGRVQISRQTTGRGATGRGDTDKGRLMTPRWAHLSQGRGSRAHGGGGLQRSYTHNGEEEARSRDISREGQRAGQCCNGCLRLVLSKQAALLMLLNHSPSTHAGLDFFTCWETKSEKARELCCFLAYGYMSEKKKNSITPYVKFHRLVWQSLIHLLYPHFCYVSGHF